MHYKIKDDVDLSVLEEYGYERVGISKNYVKDISDEIIIRVSFDREILLYIFYRMCYLEEPHKQYIKDLIDSGLVEEVNDD